MELPAFTRNFFRGYFERFDPGSVVVFDKAPFADENSLIECVLRYGLEEIPMGLNVICISRGDPPAVFRQTNLMQNVAALNWNDLQFTDEEAAGLAKLRGRSACNDVINMINDTVRGWAAGLSLMLDERERLVKATGAGLPDGPKTLFYFFADEIFKAADIAIQSFLIQTAFLPRFSPSQAKALTRNLDTQSIVAELASRNYFIVQHGVEPLRYEYHPLFREFLLARAGETYNGDQLSTLRKRAAEILYDDGQIESAVTLFQYAEDWRAIVRLVVEEAKGLMETGRGQTVHEWITALPESLVDATPWLSYWLGVSQRRHCSALARPRLEAAYHGFAQQGDRVGLLLSWCEIVDALVCEWTDLRPLDYWLDELEVHLTPRAPFPTEEIEAQVTWRVFFALAHRQPSHPRLSEWEGRILDLVGRYSDATWRHMVVNYLVIYYGWWAGRPGKAELLLRELEPAQVIEDAPALRQIIWNDSQANFLWACGENEASAAAAKQGLEQAERFGLHSWDLSLCSQGAFATLSSGDRQTANFFIETMAACLSRARPWERALYYFVSAWRSFLDHDLVKAKDHCEAALRICEKAGSPLAVSRLQNHLATLLFRLNSRERAAALVNESLYFAIECDSPILSYLCHLNLAEFALLDGDEDTLEAELTKSLAIARDYGIVNHSFWRPDNMERLYQKALEYDIETPYVQNAIRRRQVVPKEPPLHLETWPWPIKVYTLGRFSLAINDEAVDFSGKGQRRTLELLQAIVALGGRDVASGAICDALWPEAEADAAYNALQSSLHRLRKLLGKEAIMVSSGQIKLNAAKCWVDTWAAERLCNELDALLRQGAPAKKLRPMVTKLVKRIQGPFLPDNGAPWACVMRERARSCLMRTLDAVARFEEASGEWSEAVALLQRCVDADPLAEGFYQRLMACHQRLGQSADALSVYRRCQRVLSARLGIAPSAKTDAIARQLRIS